MTWFQPFFFFIDNEEAKPEKTSEYILPSSDFLFCYWKEERRIGFEIFKLQVACSWSFSVSDWAQHWEMNKHFENLSSVHLEYKGCVPGLHWCRDSACAALLCGSQRRRDWGTDQNLQPHNFSSKEQVSFNFMAVVTICSDFGAQKTQRLSLFPLFPHLFPMKWWDQMPWS